MARTERLSQEEREEGGPLARSRTWLVQIGIASNPRVAPVVHSLDEHDRFLIGRDHQPQLETEDPWLSGEHAELRRGEDGWSLCDLGSSNGTFYWGERRSTAELADGDLFETGGTFWLFRSMLIEGPLPERRAGPLGTLFPPFELELDRLRRVARTRVPMMFLGATGTGKEVLAQQVHQLSGRTGSFVAINTAAVQRNLVASELFGVEQGAHSLAERSRPGQIRAAEGGTLLLDEIGDMPLEVQAALLRVLQESELVPVGGDRPVRIDVRFLCATHRDLKQMVEVGTFRADLYARLSGCRIEIPELADRIEDVGWIIAAILARYGANKHSFTPAAYRALLAYPWPMNVRELDKVLESALAFSERERCELKHLPIEVQSYRPDVASARLPETEDLGQVYDREIQRLLTSHRGNVSAVARSMGRSRMQIHRWMKRLNLDPEGFRR